MRDRRRSWTAMALAAVSMIAACSVAPPSATTSDRAAPATAASSTATSNGFPIGSWTTTITEADLRGAGIVSEGELKENAGVFTMILDERGSWTTTQEAAVPIRWPVFRGAYTVTGPNAFQQRTDFPADFAGDVVDFTWRVENGMLMLGLPDPPDHILSIVMESHPWQPSG